MIETKSTRPESLATRVRRGVALLDEKVPGWHNRIDVEKLALEDCTACVLGQVFGSYTEGYHALKFDSGDAAKAGVYESVFNLADADRVYETLTRLWRFVIRSRQAAAFFAHPDVQGNGFDLVYALAANGDVWCWSERYGWRKSVFGNLNADSDFDRAHFTDHLVSVSVDELPVGAR